jgi:hypothetical protein
MNDKTIWIQSSENDISTKTVIDWVEYFGKRWIRTNELSIFALSIVITKEICEFEFKFENLDKTIETINSSYVTSYWYRRGQLNFANNFVPESEEEAGIYSYYKAQGATLTDFIYAALKAKRHINGYTDNRINKLNIVLKAKDIGLPHWNASHFIVVYSIAKEDVYVSDPFIGLMKYSIEQFIQGWAGVKDNSMQK